jgi:DNA-binding PucR family transcriptional regulator
VSHFNPRSGVLFDGAHVALVPTPTEEARTRLITLTRTVVTELHQPGAGVWAAVSDRVEGLANVPPSREQVRRLLRLAGDDARAVVHTPEGQWQKLAVYEILNSAREVRAAPCEPLTRLLEHDHRHRTDYVATLRAYLDAFGSISATAHALVVHPNTLRHRLQRLSEISGLTLTDPAERTVLDIDLRLLELRPENRPHGPT